ncbi:MAG: hypothetical protein WCK01_01030 [Candidatus Uhrbacteria bacterium]
MVVLFPVMFFLVAFGVGEVLFRAGQVGIALLGLVFGFNNFRPGEIQRVPFYMLTMSLASVASFTVVMFFLTS